MASLSSLLAVPPGNGGGGDGIGNGGGDGEGGSGGKGPEGDLGSSGESGEGSTLGSDVIILDVGVREFFCESVSNKF